MRAFVLSGLLFLGSAAIAAETITYTYDARGRLVAVAHSGGPSNGLNTCYTLDKVDNRTAKATSGSACASGGGGGDNVSFTISSNGPVTEGANSVFTVTKSGTATQSYDVNYATTNGTAVAPGDYTAKSGTLTFTTLQTSKTVSVTTVDDANVESNENFSMSLSNPTGGATIGTPGSATATINDNDGGGGNQPPVANFDNAGSMTCGDTITVNVVANDTDPDGNYPLSLVSANGSPGLSVSVVSSTDLQMTGITSGTKSFTYVVQDSLGAQANGSGSVSVLAPCQ